jgi:23S rRNA (uracil1939-C5)-methyltransferase
MKDNPGNRVGFIARDNKSVIGIDNCLLADPELSTVFQQAHSFEKDEETRAFRLAKDGRIISSKENTFFEMEIGRETILTHSRSFFQSNPFIANAIGDKLSLWISEMKPKTFIDLYAGAGTFTLLSAREVPSLVCMEENPCGLAAFEKNLDARNLAAVVIAGKAEERFAEWFEEVKPEHSMIFLDPPRKGIEPSLAGFISRGGVCDSLVYLSCHLGTLTRDLAIILQEGRYKVETVIPFDMFPRTKHIEVLVLLKAVS